MCVVQGTNGTILAMGDCTEVDGSPLPATGQVSGSCVHTTPRDDTLSVVSTITFSLTHENKLHPLHAAVLL